MKLSKRVALNVEYYYTLPNQLDQRYTNSLSIGFDIETGGHVFQLHFTNSTGMVENALEKIKEKDLVEFDNDKKATMVSSLMVVLCSDKEVTPVVNTGTLHQ